MESADKFRRLMALTDYPGQSIWLDAVSIDQSDHNDIVTQMAVMGDIYSNALSVAVLLPKSDEEAFNIIERLGDLASFINMRRSLFTAVRETAETKILSGMCQEFFSLIREFEKNIHRWTYWRRAWTFQEWTLAHEISLAWEGATELVNLAGVKGPILKAATMMAIYKLQNPTME
jgi:hypothetical protein